MSLSVGAHEPPLAGTSTAEIEVTAGARLAVYVACTLVALIVNYFLGKDMAWDMLNYHLYAGFSAVHDRFAQDYFAAGPPSYFNPLAYAPFYLLVSAGLPALAISSALAVVHSIILWLTFELAMCVCPSNDPRTRLTFGVFAIALAFVNPVLMQQIGSSFADITTAELVLAGWVLVAGAVRVPSAARIICAGFLLGAATALKLTNAVHAIAVLPLFIMLPLALHRRFRFGLGYVISLGAGFVIIAAPWSYRLARMFGNPLFPLMNGLFRSPEFTTEPLLHFRFIPENIGEALWRPFAIINPVRMIQEELKAPDLRYALLVVLISVLFFRWLWRRLRKPSAPLVPAESSVASRELAALGCGLGADWVLWLCNSGNGRYFLPMACVTAVVIVALLFRLFANRPKVRSYILAGIFGIQAIQLWMGTEFRWDPTPWDGPWLNITVPEKLATEPALYLTMGTQSNSFVAPFLAPGAGLVNFSGGYTLSADGATGARIDALIHRYAPNVRVLLRGDRLYENEERRAPRHSQVDDSLAPLGLKVDAGDCATITVHGLPPDLEITFKDSKSVEGSHDATYLLSCHVVPDSTDRSAQIARRRAVDLVLDRLEDACPKLFQPRHLRTEHDGDTWRRLYMNTDLTAWVSHGWVKFRNPVRGDPLVFVGRESDWANAPMPLACGRRSGVYFANVLKSNQGP